MNLFTQEEIYPLTSIVEEEYGERIASILNDSGMNLEEKEKKLHLLIQSETDPRRQLALYLVTAGTFLEFKKEQKDA